MSQLCLWVFVNKINSDYFYRSRNKTFFWHFYQISPEIVCDSQWALWPLRQCCANQTDLRWRTKTNTVQCSKAQCRVWQAHLFDISYYCTWLIAFVKTCTWAIFKHSQIQLLLSLSLSLFLHNLAPPVSSSSLTSIQIPSLCLSKAPGGNNKRSALWVMEDKQRQVMWLPQDCTHDVSIWPMNKLSMFISVFAVLEVALHHGARGGGALGGRSWRAEWTDVAGLDSSTVLPRSSPQQLLLRFCFIYSFLNPTSSSTSAFKSK